MVRLNHSNKARLQKAPLALRSALLQMPIAQDVPWPIISSRMEVHAYCPQALARVKGQTLPPIKAGALGMFPSSDCPDGHVPSANVEHTPSLITVSPGLCKDAQNIAADSQSETENYTQRTYAVSPVDHLMLEKTQVPQRLKEQPQVARLLVAREDYDRRLATTTLEDSAIFGLWNTRQNVEEGLADLVGRYIPNESARTGVRSQDKTSSVIHEQSDITSDLCLPGFRNVSEGNPTGECRFCVEQKQGDETPTGLYTKLQTCLSDTLQQNRSDGVGATPHADATTDSTILH